MTNISNDERKKKFEQNQYGITMLAVMSIVGIVVYTSLGRTSNDSGRVALRSTKIPLKNQHDSVPPIMMFDGYEIAPAYIEDRTDYACGDKRATRANRAIKPTRVASMF